MRIKKRLQINVAVSVLMVLVMCVVVLLSLYRLNKANDLSEIASDLITGALERVTFRNDYLRSNITRAKEQWFAKQQEVTALLKLASEHFQNTEDRTHIAALIENQKTIGNIFSAIVANREKGDISPGLSREVEDRLVNQLNMRVYEIVLHSRALLESSRKARASSLGLAAFAIVSILLLTVMTTLVNSWTVIRAITERVEKLRKGAAVIGGGDLDHRIDARGADEFAELSEAFNAMTAKLGASYHDLENEIGVRAQAEDALRESEQRWVTTLASIGDAVIATDQAGRIVFMNPVAEELTGWTLREASSMPVTEVFNIINEHTRNVVESPVSRVIREGVVVGLANHTILVRKDGTEAPIDDSGAPIRDGGGKTMGVVLVFRDITERKRAEEGLRESEERYRSLFDNMLNGYAYCKMLFDQNGPYDFTYLNVNAAFETLTGLKNVTGKNVSDVIPGIRQSDPELFEIYGRVALTGTPERFETYVEALEMWFSISVYSPRKEHFVAVFDVITDRKKAEEALRERERQMTRAQEMAHLGSWELDLVNNRLSWSDEVYRIFGLRPQEFGATYDAFLEAVHPEDRAAVDAAYSGSLREGNDSYEIEHRVVRRSSGEVRIVHEKCEHMRDETGRIIKSVGMVHDVTEGIKAEEALRKAYDEQELRVKERTAELSRAYESLTEETREREQLETQLRQAQKMEALGTLSGGIAHDFNNILAAIIGFTELVASHAAIGSRDERHLKRIMAASLRGRELVSQMLTFSRKTEQENRPVQLSSIVNETIKLIRASTPTTIAIRASTHSESGLILGDPTRIQQVLMNLFTNSVYAMREKGGKLDIELSDFSVSPSNGNPHGIEPGLYMKLVVRDTGTGIPPEIVDRIFDPFFTTKSVGEGTGLGLSVVMGIVKQSKGYITVESEPGRGSTLSVYFPKIVGRLETDEVGDDAVPTGTERILFVDDEEALVEMGEDILADLGYEVTSRTSSREALALLKQDVARFDLVITDQTMPEMTGVELAKEILVIRADMPIIMCTGFSHMVDADKAKAAGIKAFVMKPLTKREIARTIRKTLDE